MKDFENLGSLMVSYLHKELADIVLPILRSGHIQEFHHHSNFLILEFKL